jgi:hypothetical protein
MAVMMPSATDIREEGQKIAERIVDDFRKPDLTEDQKFAEDQVLSSIAFMYWPRPDGSRNWDHTVTASLVDTQDAAPYMDYPEKVLAEVKSNLFFLKKCSTVWRRTPSQWALSWNNAEKDD